MKKSTLKVLSLVMAIAMILGTLTAIPFSALPGNGPVAVEEEHVHTKSGDAIKVVEPTCTLYGYSVYECECGKTFIADVTEKTEHNYQEVGEIPADCATGTVGYTAGVKCVVCGDVKSGCFEIAPEHKDAYRIIDGTYKFDEEGNIVTTPDCTAGVTYQHYCAACGQILEDNVDTIVDYLNDQDDDHDYTIEVRDDAPTCEEGGYLYVVCESEGEYYFGDCAYEGPVAIYVAALGHNWSDPIEDQYGDPYKKYTQCTRCGAIEEIPEPEEEEEEDDDPEHPVQPNCHDWVSNGFVFSIGGEANLSSREFTGTAEQYLTQYAMYSNVSDLYELFACTICNRTRLVLRVEKLDKEHLYGDYTFNFEGKVLTLNPLYNPDDEDSQMYLTTEFGVHNPDYDPEDEESEEYLTDPFSVVLHGGIETKYACGEKTVTTKVCAFCKALEIGPTEDDIEKSDNELAHRYSEYWICQNEECKKMVKVGTTTDEQTGEEVDVFEEERPTVSVDLGTNGIITLPLKDNYYKCGDCTHAHVTKVCFNPAGKLVERENWTLTVIGDDTTPEATPDLPKVYEQLFEIELDKEEAKKDYSGIELCMDFDGAQFEATEHEFGRNVRETGDCKTKTVEYKVCKICGSKYDIVEGEYGEHNWTEWEHLDPTCQQYECDQRHCTICDKYEEKNKGEYGEHQLGEWETVQEADCLHQEIKERYCTVEDCEYFEREVGEFGDHDMDFIVDKAANCVDTGKGHYTCSVCGVAGEKNVETAINPDNHKGPVTAETTVEPTCTAEGVRTYTCAACGKTWDEEIEKIPHDWDIIEAKEATCFEAGNKRYERCKVCGEYGKDEETGEEFKGELILAYKHEGYIAEKTLENGDVAKEATVWVAVTDPNFKAKDYALRIRAVEVETKVKEEVKYYGYTIRVVAPTCTRDGYVVGKYCTKCAEIYGNEDLIADIEGEFKYTGYIIPATGNHKIVHIVSDPEALPTFGGVCGGEVYYAYAVDYCVVCGKYYQEEAEDNEGFEPVSFDMLTAKEHRAEYNDELFDETGALEVVTYTLVFNGEAFIELTDDNAESYPDCTYARYTAKKCRFCGKFFEITVKTEAFGHYYVNDGQGNKLFLMDCDKYDAKYVGVTCSACGGIVPEYSVELITEGEFTGYARECYWVSLDGSNLVPTYDRQLVKALGYLLVEHQWIETQGCENAIIRKCEVCGIEVMNFDGEDVKAALEADAEMKEEIAAGAREFADARYEDLLAAQEAKENADNDLLDAQTAFNEAEDALETAIDTLGVPSIEDDLETEEDETQEATGAWKDYEDALEILADPQAAYENALADYEIAEAALEAAEKAVEDARAAKEAARIELENAHNALVAAGEGYFDVDEDEPVTLIQEDYVAAKAAYEASIVALEDAEDALGVPAVEDDPETQEEDESQEATGAIKDFEDAKAALEEAELALVDPQAIYDAALEALNAAIEALGVPSVEDDPETEEEDESQEATGAWKDYEDAKAALEAAQEAKEEADDALTFAENAYNFANARANHLEWIADIARSRADSERRYHEYILRDGGFAKFDADNYDAYAFNNVVYPTVTSEGFGTLTCIKCGEVLEVTIPALTAELSVSFDDFDETIREQFGEYGIKNVIVGDEVTATIKITAKNFKFHNFEILIDTWTNHFDLVDVEVLYDFGDVNAVNAYIVNGYVVLDCINSIGNAVVEEANDAEFLRITFKSGDLTYEDACTAFSWGIDEAEYSVIDEDGDVDYGYAGLANDGWFGGDINVYNPDYYYSAIEVLEAAYNDGYAAQYDFNKDGRVDLVDYFAMVDYITSAQTIADFCELIGYDLEAVIDGLEYRDALNKCEVVNTPDGPLTIYRTLDNLKDNVRIAFASANYRASIIEAEVTIAQFAQNVINNI